MSHIAHTWSLTLCTLFIKLFLSFFLLDIWVPLPFHLIYKYVRKKKMFKIQNFISFDHKLLDLQDKEAL